MESSRDRPGVLPSQPSLGFDLAGYAAGKLPPDVPAVLQVRPSGADDTALLQAAIDELAARSRAKPNFHGALVLSPGTFRVEGRLRIAESGIVIRGSTNPRQPTRIIAVGTSRRTLLEIGASGPPRLAHRTAFVAEAVPAGSRTLSVAEIDGFEIGNRVVVQRPSTDLPICGPIGGPVRAICSGIV